MYGRVTSYECASGVDIYMSWFQYFATCVVPGALEKVSALCSGKTSCELTASPVNFINTGGISCPETINYIRVTYTCSSKYFICHLTHVLTFLVVRCLSVDLEINSQRARQRWIDVIFWKHLNFSLQTLNQRCINGKLLLTLKWRWVKYY